MTSSRKAVNLALLAGQILLRSGAETARVEDTCRRILTAHSLEDVSVLVITTGILVSVTNEQETITQMRRIQKRSIDLGKIDRVNQLSRDIVAKKICIEEAWKSLKEIDMGLCSYGRRLQLLAAGVASAGFAFLFGAHVHDLLVAAVLGVLAAVVASVSKVNTPRFFADFLASFVAALLALISERIGITLDAGSVIIGAIMVLVPGVLITTAVQDVLSDDLLSSVAKLTEAVFIALAIAGGVTIALTLEEVLPLG